MPSKNASYRYNSESIPQKTTSHGMEERQGWASYLFHDIAGRWQKPSKEAFDGGECGKEFPSLKTEVTMEDRCQGRCATCGNIGTIDCKCDDCGDDEFGRVTCHGHNSGSAPEQQKVAAWWRRVTRSRVGGEYLPGTGQTCLIIKGDVDKDLGRMAIVLRCTPQRVWVGYRDFKTGKQMEHLKTPGSLVLLDDGLEAHNDKHGRLWILKRETGNP